MDPSHDTVGESLDPTDAPPRSERARWIRRVLVVLAVALLARVVCVLGQPLIGADSSRFLATAELIERGDYNEAIRQDYHPLPAFGFAIAHRAVSSLASDSTDLDDGAAFEADRQRREVAAYGLSVVVGLLAVWLLIDLTRRLFPSIRPEMVGYLAAFQPYMVRASADIMSDALFVACFLLALRQAHDSLVRRSFITVVSTGGAIGLAYLSRPEALVLLPTITLYWLASLRRDWPRLLTNVVVMAIGAAVLVFPYVLALYYDSGDWMITRKKSLSALLGLAGTNADLVTIQLAGPVDAMLDHRAAGRLLDRWFFASPEVLAGATTIGLGAILWRREWHRGHTLFATAVGFLLFVLLLLLHSSEDYGYVTKRHVITVAALCLPFAARGIVEFAGWLALVSPERWRGRLTSIVLIGVLVVIGVKALAPQRFDQVAQRDAAELIRSHGGIRQRILTPSEKVAYYCGSDRLLWNSDPTGLLREVRAEQRIWIVFYREKWPGCARAFAEAAAEDSSLQLFRTLEEPNRDKPRHLDLYLWERP